MYGIPGPPWRREIDVSDVKELKSDALEGLNALYRQYSRWLNGRLRAHVDPEQAADVVQETYLRAAPYSAGQIRHPRAFLLRIAMNVVRDESRRSKRRGPSEQISEPVTARPTGLGLFDADGTGRNHPRGQSERRLPCHPPHQTGRKRSSTEDGGGGKPLVALNKDWPGIDWGRIVPVPHPGPSGESLTSWLLLPPGSAPGARPPVVVEVYPGTAPRSAPSALLPGGTRLQNNPAVIAAAGYAVLIVSLPLAPGENRPAAKIADRILVAVDAAGDLGLVDPRRIALIGHSFGGYGVLSAVTQSDRFSAIIASNGYPDLSLSMQLPPFFRVAPEEGVPVGQMVGWGETGRRRSATSPLLPEPMSKPALSTKQRLFAPPPY